MVLKINLALCFKNYLEFLVPKFIDLENVRNDGYFSSYCGITRFKRPNYFNLSVACVVY